MKFPKMVIDCFATTSFDMVAYEEGITKDGSPIKHTLNGLKGNYQAKSQAAYTDTGKKIVSSGVIYVDGDILPLHEISGGSVTISGFKREIASVRKALNPDGTVNHCRIDLK